MIKVFNAGWHLTENYAFSIINRNRIKAETLIDVVKI